MNVRKLRHRKPSARGDASDTGRAPLTWEGHDFGSTSVIAFYEKAGRSQAGSFVFSVDKVHLSRRVSPDAMPPSALSSSEWFARRTLGVLVAAGAAVCLSPCDSALTRVNPGQAINAHLRPRQTRRSEKFLILNDWGYTERTLVTGVPIPKRLKINAQKGGISV